MKGCSSNSTNAGPKHHDAPHSGATIGVQGKAMRASVTLDDDLLKRAHEYTGLTERAELLREALKSIIAREAGRRLLALAGTAPKIKDVRRRQVDEP
jgi:Arc/MetJ family transcription regulator